MAKREINIILMGLYNAGKSTFLYRIAPGENPETPAPGWDMEKFTQKIKETNAVIHNFDVGGRCGIRPLLHHYYQKTDGIVFMIDSSDVTYSLREAKWELQNMLNDDGLDGVPLLVIANKQDLPGAATIEDVTDKLELNDIRKRKWHIVPWVATDMSGTGEGFQWLIDTANSSPRDIPKDKQKEKSKKPFWKMLAHCLGELKSKLVKYT